MDDTLWFLLAVATRLVMWATGCELTSNWSIMLVLEPWLRLWDGETVVLDGWVESKVERASVWWNS